MNLRRFWTLLLLLGLLALSSAATANAADKPDAKKPVIPVFRLSGAITEKPPVADILFGGVGGESLEHLVARLKKAGEDENVKAIVVLYEGASIGRGQIEELRQAMAAFRAKGKDIYVHADSLSMGEYVLLSGASRISVVPTADIWVTGLAGEAMYLRGLLDKLGVQPDFLTCGEYKSAAETYMRTGPSSAADEMQNWLLDSLYASSIELIAEGRKVDAAKVRGWIDNGPYTGEKAVAEGLIDAVEHRQDFTAVLKGKYGDDVVFDRKYGHKKGPEVDLSSPFGLLKLWSDALNEAKGKKSSKDAVAIVYVEGAIVLGDGGVSPFSLSGESASSTAIRKALDEAAKEDSVKAVVLRVNSPGGSAVASEIILDATKRVKARKPFVVSMGDVAGSGGYYVACGSNLIYADKATITGSIGVVGGKLATTGLWDKIGVSFKEYRRGANAGMLSSGNVFTAAEKVRMQAWMDEIYGVFKGHVVAARGDRLKKPIDELAGGRVYTGEQALELGLVDKLGSLDDAIQYIAGEAKLEPGKYEVRVIPKNRDFFEQLFETTGDEGDTDRVGLADAFRSQREQLPLVELALPYLRQLDPQRAATVVDALQQLEMLHRDGVSLLTPPILTGR